MKEKLTKFTPVLIFIMSLGRLALAAAAPESALERAKASLPSERQVAWQKNEVEALVHFGISTFTGREWGGGKETPAIFNPSNIDASQWVNTAGSFGAKAVILMAKHHDGFCLWPTETTDFSVKNSPWRDGKGDLVREVADACSNAGIKFGIYVSPADMHEISYGWQANKYNDFFCAQLRELLTNYGEISQVFLPSEEPGLRQQRFDWQRFYSIVRELQPNAIISFRGPDARWVGTDLGMARESEWSVVPIPTTADRYDWQPTMARDIGSRSRLEQAAELHWYPALANVSLRDSWFWAPNKDKTIKSLNHLLSIYEESVGRNAVLQLNITPDTTGRTG